MAQTTRFCWVRTSDQRRWVGATESWYDSSVDHRPSRMKHRMAFGDDLVAAIKDPDFHNKPAVEQCAIHIHIAITLVHELAHCLYHHRQRENMMLAFEQYERVIYPREPYIGSSLRQELGFMFEISLMGGVVRPGYDGQRASQGMMVDNNQFDGSRGLQLRMPASDCSEQRTGYKISDHSILSLLHEDTWRPRACVPLYLIPILATSVPTPQTGGVIHTTVLTADQVPVTTHGLLINTMVAAYRSSQSDSESPQPLSSSQSDDTTYQQCCQKRRYSQELPCQPDDNQSGPKSDM